MLYNIVLNSGVYFFQGVYCTFIALLVDLKDLVNFVLNCAVHYKQLLTYFFHSYSQSKSSANRAWDTPEPQRENYRSPRCR